MFPGRPRPDGDQFRAERFLASDGAYFPPNRVLPATFQRLRLIIVDSAVSLSPFLSISLSLSLSVSVRLSLRARADVLSSESGSLQLNDDVIVKDL